MSTCLWEVRSSLEYLLQADVNFFKICPLACENLEISQLQSVPHSFITKWTIAVSPSSLSSSSPLYPKKHDVFLMIKCERQLADVLFGLRLRHSAIYTPIAYSLLLTLPDSSIFPLTCSLFGCFPFMRSASYNKND